MICDHWVMRRRVESTSGSKDGLGFTVPAYVSEGSDKTRTNVRLLYKGRRVQVFYSDTNIFRALEEAKLL